MTTAQNADDMAVARTRFKIQPRQDLRGDLVRAHPACREEMEYLMLVWLRFAESSIFQDVGEATGRFKAAGKMEAGSLFLCLHRAFLTRSIGLVLSLFETGFVFAAVALLTCWFSSRNTLACLLPATLVVEASWFLVLSRVA
jgi:hypothetical protein